MSGKLPRCEHSARDGPELREARAQRVEQCFLEERGLREARRGAFVARGAGGEMFDAVASLERRGGGRNGWIDGHEPSVSRRYERNVTVK